MTKYKLDWFYHPYILNLSSKFQENDKEFDSTTRENLPMDGWREVCLEILSYGFFGYHNCCLFLSTRGKFKNGESASMDKYQI